LYRKKGDNLKRKKALKDRQVPAKSKVGKRKKKKTNMLRSPIRMWGEKGGALHLTRQHKKQHLKNNEGKRRMFRGDVFS